MTPSEIRSAAAYELAEQFLERYRQGERPQIKEYVDLHPELAFEIKEVFPAMAMMEKIVLADESQKDEPRGRPVGCLPQWQIGDFRVLREVGRGGMGIVYEAEQISLGRHVALKLLPERALADSRMKQRFEREAKAAAKLHHTNIVPVFGVGEHAGTPYYAMQFIQGSGLDAVLEELRRLARRSEKIESFGPCKEFGDNHSHRTQGGRANEADSAVPDELARSLLEGRFEGPLTEPGMGATGSHVGPPGSPPDARTVTALPGARTPGSPEPTASHAPPSPTLASLNLPGQSGVGLAGPFKKLTYWQSVAHIGVQVADALDYAHKQGVIHRDIKPSNLLLDTHGIVWVTDFGLAKLDGHQDLTHTGDLLGTFRYMPPEAFEAKVDSRGDIYSLGLTLYEMLALQPAFGEHDKQKLLRQVMTDEPPHLSAHNPTLPRDLITIVQKSIDREPERRYATAAGFSADLRRFLDDQSILARRTSSMERVRRWCRRNPGVAAMLAVVALMLVGITVWTLVKNTELSQQTAQLTAALEQSEANRRDASDKLFGSLLAQAKAVSLSRRPGQRFESLRLLDEAGLRARELDESTKRILDLRNATVGAFAVPDVAHGHVIGPWPDDALYASFDADFTLYARTDKKGTCSIRRVADDVELYLLPVAGTPSLSNDGRFLGVIDGGRARVWRLTGAAPSSVLDEPGVCSPDFRADSHSLALGYLDGRIGLRDLEAGGEIRRLPATVFRRGPVVALHPTEPLVAVAELATRIVQVREWSRGTVVAELSVPKSGFSLAWSPNVQTLAVGTDGYDVLLFDRDDRGKFTLSRTINTQSGAGTRVVFNAREDRLLTWGHGLIGRMYDPNTGWELAQFELARAVSLPRFDQTGQRLAGLAVDGRLQFWDVAEGREHFILGEPEAPALEVIPNGPPCLVAGGRLLAASLTVSRQHGLSFWDTATGAVLDFTPLERLTTSQTYGQHTTAGFDPPTGDLYSLGSERFRWPVRSNGSGSWTIGPPGLTGRQQPESPYVVPPDGAAVSLDGAWNISSANGGGEMQVRDAQTAQSIATLPGGPDCSFSPDSKLLALGGANGGLYRTGTWREVLPGLRFSGTPTQFSPDSRILAIGLESGTVLLLDAATAHELVRLEGPDRGAISALTFAPNGSQLIILQANPGKRLHLWDLALIRRNLAKRGLDWDAPPYPPENVKPPPAPRVRVQVVGADLTQDVDKLAQHGIVTQTERLKKYPNDAQALAQLGASLEWLGKHGAAFDAYTKAIECGGPVENLFFERAGIAFQLERWQVVIEDATPCLNRRATNVRLRVWRAESLRMLGRYADAVADYTKLLEHYPKDFGIYVKRAKCFDALGDVAQAAADRAEAIKLEPTDPEVLNKLAWRLVTRSGGERNAAWAIDLIRKAMQQKPASPLYLNTLGVAQYRNHQFQEALATLEKSLAAGNGATDAYDLFFMAMCHARIGNMPKANECFERAIRWTSEQTDLSALYAGELARFRAEAEDVLRRK